MKLSRNKRGVELSMNVIIIAILVILVLVILAVFFTGGIANLFNKIKLLYGAQLTDVSAKIASCNTLCQQYITTGSPLYKDRFCEGTKVDINGDGAIKGDEEGVNCIDPNINVQCSEIPAC
ncbi:MAG: hypothetical protein AB1571_04285 [Nanoarchaeota archaeon]